MRVSDLVEAPEGFILKVRKSKTDQEGRGRQIPLAYFADPVVCPVRSIRAWLEVVGSGALFRSVSRWDHISEKRLSGEAISQVIKVRGEQIGLESSTLGGHSLRAGFVSEADRRGVPDRVITSITGHRTTAMLATYSRPRSLFKDGPSQYFAVTE